MKSIKRRGFSLIEIVVTVAILSILMGIAIPFLGASKQKTELRNTARKLVQNLKKAQIMARSGRANVPSWGANDRTAQAGVRFISSTQYAVFVDRDGLDNGGGSEADVEIVDLSNSGYPLEFASPPVSVRFNKNGTLSTTSDVDLTIQDTSTGERRIVRVTYSGKVSLFR